MAHRSIRQIVRTGCRLALLFAAIAWCLDCTTVTAAKPGLLRSLKQPSERERVIASLPMNRLTRQAQQQIHAIADSPTIYRRLPTEAIDCDRDMFMFLARQPEVMVGLWDLMGITNVQINRTGPFTLEAVDGAGTTCKVDLVYGDPHLHIYVAHGSYDGRLTAKAIHGSGVFVLRSTYSQGATPSETRVTGTLDCFVQFDSLGADLVARTFKRIDR